jgi:hypothetical protein
MLDRAYDIGRRAAIYELEKLASDPMEKEAIFSALKGIYEGSKLLRGAGWLMGIGGPTANWIGAPLGSGLLGAASAEDGQGLKGFATGAVGGLIGAGVGAVAGKAAPALARGIGKRLAKTDFGKSVWNQAGKINKGYGANTLKKYEADLIKAKKDHFADPANAGKAFKPPEPPMVKKQHSFGQNVLTKVPGALGIAGGLAGFTYGTTGGEEIASSMWDSAGIKQPGFGSFQQRNVFNPVG